MKKIKYYKQKNGEWIRPGKDYHIACCDCGLVHKMVFGMTAQGHVAFRVWRVEKLTKERRKHISNTHRGE